jgi:hypothetical protein
MSNYKNILLYDIVLSNVYLIKIMWIILFGMFTNTAVGTVKAQRIRHDTLAGSTATTIRICRLQIPAESFLIWSNNEGQTRK